MNNMGPKIRELRLLREMTQAQLGKLIGQDGAYVSKVENRVRPVITTEMVERFASALKTTASELLR